MAGMMERRLALELRETATLLRQEKVGEGRDKPKYEHVAVASFICRADATKEADRPYIVALQLETAETKWLHCSRSLEIRPTDRVRLGDVEYNIGGLPAPSTDAPLRKVLIWRYISVPD